jgi:hypothetical protein
VDMARLKLLYHYISTLYQGSNSYLLPSQWHSHYT